jgi:hypothetical protein
MLARWQTSSMTTRPSYRNEAGQTGSKEVNRGPEELRGRASDRQPPQLPPIPIGRGLPRPREVHRAVL